MGIESMHTKRLVRYMMYLPGGEIRRPTADVHQALRLVEVSLLPPQFLRQQLLLCDIHCSAVVSLKNSIFNHRNTDATNVPDLSIGPNYSARDIAVAVLLMHRLYGLCQGGSVLGMDRSKKMLKG